MFYLYNCQRKEDVMILFVVMLCDMRYIRVMEVAVRPRFPPDYFDPALLEIPAPLPPLEYPACDHHIRPSEIAQCFRGVNGPA